MASPYRSSSPTLTGAAQSVVHASTSTIVQDERELAIKFKAARDDESLSEGASYSPNSDPQDSESPHPRKQQSTPLPFLPKPNADPNLVEWEGPDDPENPQNWSFWYKWWLTAVCTLMTLNVYVLRPQKLYYHACSLLVIPDTLSASTFTSSAPSSSVPIIAQELHASREVGDLVLTLFLIGFMLGPIFWGPGSELIGRRPIFIGTFAIYTLFHIGQARADDMTTLLVTRFLCGFFAVAPLTNSTGVIADLWDPVNRGIATSLFASSVFLGPVLGPVIGSL